ncbi:hypothetical protein BD289DRAFT_263252 [Coniella lustricola]|uniref:Uncharacterized protein n=1 Tax=Coniella lustricola TaxID=2025994 RepID=A0A2T3A7I4_9PEZI|nr:hypothetical protein BD289DRAFT_263252 [Coniella lustricola]
MARFQQLLIGVSAFLALTTSAIEILSTFDDIDTDQLVNFASIGVYNGLDFLGISAVDVGPETSVAGIIPQSGSNVAYYGALNAITTSETPSITARYEISTIGQFAFQSFYYGCLGALAAVPVACTITVQGFLDGLAVDDAVNEFEFEPSGVALSAAMQEATLSAAFANVDTVTLSTVYDGPQPASITVLDSMSYAIVVNTA